jgi:hypothetical protein
MPGCAGGWIEGSAGGRISGNVAGRVHSKPGFRGNGRDAADVDRQEVERDVRPAGNRDRAGVRVESSCRRQDQTGICHGCEWGQIDMGLAVRVLAADQPGKHAGVGRLRLTADQGQAHTRFWTQGEAPQHLDMGVAGAKQHDVGLDRTG